MTDNQRRILEMLFDNKIGVDEAVRLLGAVESPPAPNPSTKTTERVTKKDAKYLRVTVVPNPEAEGTADFERVNVRVPMGLIRAGIKLTSLIPKDATQQVNSALRDKGIDMDISDFKGEDLEMLVEALNDLEVDVESGKEKVRVFVE